MNKCLKYTENKTFLPLVVITIFILLILLTPINSIIWEKEKILTISLVIWLIWFGLFLVENRKGAQIADTKGLLIIKLLFAVVISLFFANTVWFSGYLTLNPISAIVKGNLHVDTLFHSTIAESIKNYGYPSVLINNTDFVQYHCGSHFIITLLSIIFDISVFNTYNFLYPVICIPIYAFLLVSVVIEIRKYKNETAQLSILDYLILSCFITGFLPTFILKHIGIWKSSWIVSESFLFSLIFFLLYMLLVLKITKRNHHWKNTSLFLLALVFIFICSSMKISVGFLLTTGIIYFNFRKNTRKIQSWIANLFFFAAFITSYTIFSEAAGTTEFQLFSFVRNYIYILNINNYISVPHSLLYVGAILHYFVLLFFSLAALYYQLSINKPLKHAIKSKKLLIEETLFVVCIVSLLPGIFLNIDGGSAAYFSYFQELLAICILLVGYNILGKLQQKIKLQNEKVRNSVKISMILLTCIVLYNSKTVYSFIKIINSPENTTTTLLTNVQDIMKIPKIEKKEYSIFLDDNAEIWIFYRNTEKAINKQKTAIFFYPGLTGIRLLNGVYTDGTDVFLSNGTYLQNIETSGYGINKNTVIENANQISKTALEEAKNKAKNENLKYLIYLYNDKYQIIEL